MQTVSLQSAEARIANYYGVFFLAIGSVMPFAAVWFQHLEFTPAMSGTIFAVPSILTILLTVLVGRWADRLRDWRTAIILCNAVVSILVAYLLFRQSYWEVLVVYALVGFFSHATAPIIDAAALDLTHRRGSDFARLRAVGSLGFIVGIVAGGALFDVIGISWFAWIMFAGMLARTWASVVLPHFREGSTAQSETTQHAMREFLQPGIVLVLFGAALINASHGFVNLFAVLHWTSVGISTTMGSILWTVGVAAEIALMWGFRHLAKSVSARKCLLWSAIIATLRWFVTGTDPSLPVLFLLQSLHAITFALMFLASVNFIARRVHPKHAAQAQSVSAMMVTFCMAISIWVAGWLYGIVGGQGYWAMALMAIVGGVLVALSFFTTLQDVQIDAQSH